MAICPMPWFPVYAAETLSDEDFSAWNPAARGCWFTLITRCWKDGSIPYDLSILAKLCGENPDAMLEHWKSIGSKFAPVPGCPDRLIGIRTEIEREKAIAQAEKLSHRGKSGATARWKDANPMLKHSSSNT